MSQTTTDAAVVAVVEEYLLESIIAASMFALTVYEYIITLQREVTWIWLRKWTLATWIFLANRYLTIAAVIIVVSRPTAQSCDGWWVTVGALESAQYFIFAVFSTMRVFATSDFSVQLSVLTLVLNLVPIGIHADSTFFTLYPGLGTLCGAVSRISNGSNINLTLVHRFSVIVADILVVGLTLHKTFRSRLASTRGGCKAPLSTLLLRHGVAYFVAFLAMNIAQILVTALPSFADTSPVTPISVTLTAILTSRFLLNLRQVVYGEKDVRYSRSSLVGSGFRVPSLRNVIGNMGQDLDYGFEEETSGECRDDDAVAEEILTFGMTSDTSEALAVKDSEEVQEVLENLVMRV